MAWDKNRPRGDQPWNLGDDAIRENNDALELYTAREHQDIALNSADSGKHLEGSGRMYISSPGVGTPLTVLDLNANYNSPVSAFNTGRHVFDRDNKIWNVCVDGAGGLWEQLSELEGPLLVGGDITIPTGAQLVVPPTEPHISDGTNSLDIFSHAARHLVGGDDRVYGLVNSLNLFNWTGSQALPVGGAPLTQLVHTLDYSTRGGISTCAAIGISRYQLSGADGVGITTEANLRINGALAGPVAAAASSRQSGINNDFQIVTMGLFTAVPAEVDVEIELITSYALGAPFVVTLLQTDVLWLDLGEN